MTTERSREFLRAFDRSLCEQNIEYEAKRESTRLGAPVLKLLVDRVLRQRGDVLAFASAPPNQGGSGAVLVLLDSR